MRIEWVIKRNQNRIERIFVLLLIRQTITIPLLKYHTMYDNVSIIPFVTTITCAWVDEGVRHDFLQGPALADIVDQLCCYYYIIIIFIFIALPNLTTWTRH